MIERYLVASTTEDPRLQAARLKAFQISVLLAPEVLNAMTNAMSRAVNQRKVFGALMASFPLAYVVWQTQVCT